MKGENINQDQSEDTVNAEDVILEDTVNAEDVILERNVDDVNEVKERQDEENFRQKEEKNIAVSTYEEGSGARKYTEEHVVDINDGEGEVHQECLKIQEKDEDNSSNTSPPSCSYQDNNIQKGQGKEGEGDVMKPEEERESSKNPRNDIDKMIKLEAKVNQHQTKIEQLKTDLTKLKEAFENQPKQADIQPVAVIASVQQVQTRETLEKDIQEEQIEIENEEKALENSLEKSLEKSILTTASFFISFHMLLANSQQPKNNLLQLVLLGILITMIWVSTTVLLFIWWFKMQGIGDRIRSLETRQGELMSRATNNEIGGIRPHLKLTVPKLNSYRSILVFLGVFATGFSIYFGCISYLLLAIPTGPSTIQLPFTRGFADL